MTTNYNYKDQRYNKTGINWKLTGMMKSPENPALMESFENRRIYPRLKMHLPVTITSTTGEKLKAYIYNLSPDGIQIRYTVNDKIDMFQELISHDENTKSGKCNLKFDLGFTNSIAHVDIDAYPVYSTPVGENEMACGMFFSEKKLSENKKISNFLFYQLQSSFAELEYLKEENDDEGNEQLITARRTVIENTQKSNNIGDVKGIGNELNELILQIGGSNVQLEPIKQILFHILSSLKANLEVSRHIDERINHLEHRLSRRG